MIAFSERPSRMQRRVLLILLLCASMAVPVQALLNDALGDGIFGQTSASAVFGPFVLWAAADVGTLVLFARVTRRDRFAIGVLSLLAVACATGTYFACMGVTSYLRVV